MGEIFGSSPQKHSGTFPNLFGEADFGGNFQKQSPKTLGNAPECFSGRRTLGEIFGSSPQRFRIFFRGGGLWGEIFGSSPQKHSGTFPNFFSDRLTLGEIFGSSPQKHSGTFPNFFWEADFGGNFQKQSPKTLGNVVCFLGIASENFPQSLPLRAKFGNVPECFWGLLPKISPKVSLSEKISGTFPSVFGDCFLPSKSASPKKFGNVPDCFWGLLPKISPKSASPKKNSGTFPSVFGDRF